MLLNLESFFLSYGSCISSADQCYRNWTRERGYSKRSIVTRNGIVWYRFCACLWSQAWEQKLRCWGECFVLGFCFGLVFACCLGGFFLRGSFTVPFLDQLFSFPHGIACFIMFDKETLKHVLLFVLFAGCICLHASGSSRLQNIYCESKGWTDPRTD